MIKEKPIIFLTPMVQALLNTKPGIWPAMPIDPAKPYKCQTRRVVKPRYREGEAGFEVATDEKTGAKGIIIINEEGGHSRDGYYNPPYWDDILWVRETWRVSAVGIAGSEEFAQINYSTGDFMSIGINNEQSLCYTTKSKWQSPYFFPRKAARLFLEVKSIRLERLQEISEEDAKAEGAGICTWFRPYKRDEGESICFNNEVPTRKAAFFNLWDSINAKRGYSWESNPWVWVYEFMRIK
jgi:hypothetical protein